MDLHRGESTVSERGPFRSGVSILELLTVVTCVVTLLAVIAPSISAALGKSRLSLCLERMRAIGQASSTYSHADIAESAIPVHRLQFQQDPYQPTFIGAYEWGGKSGIGWQTWVPQFSNSPLGSKYGTRAGFGPATRPLNDILYPRGFRDNLTYGFVRAGAEIDTQLALDAYRCPADDGPPLAAHCGDWVNHPEQTSFDHFGTSYAANIFMIGAGGRIVSNSPYLRGLSAVPNPARTLNYEENIGRWAWAARSELPECFDIAGSVGVDPGPTKAIRGWHGKDWTYNRAFVDAHVETQQIYRDGTEDSGGYGLHYRNETLAQYPVFPNCANCAPGATDCPGSPTSFQSLQCVIVRGDGWQKDTLPAPLICTGLFWNRGRPSFEYCVQGE